MNKYSQTRYYELPLTQWNVINNLIKQWNKQQYNDPYHAYEAQYLTMLALIINQPKLNQKILKTMEQYLPERLYTSLNLLDKKTMLFLPNQKRYNIGLIINNLIYYFKNAHISTGRFRHFFDLEQEVCETFETIYEGYKQL